MALIMRPEPFARDIDRLFSSLFGPGDTEQQRFVPAMDLVEEGDHYVLRADLPGLSEEDVSIEIQEDNLTIAGERRQEERTERTGYSRVERSYGRFSRSLSLPQGTNPDAVTAAFEKGVLEVRIPKPEERKPRKITIAGGGQKTIEGSAA